MALSLTEVACDGVRLATVARGPAAAAPCASALGSAGGHNHPKADQVGGDNEHPPPGRDATDDVGEAAGALQEAGINLD